MTTIAQLKELLNNYNDDEQVIFQFYTRDQLETANDRTDLTDDEIEMMQDSLEDWYVIQL